MSRAKLWRRARSARQAPALFALVSLAVTAPVFGAGDRETVAPSPAVEPATTPTPEPRTIADSPPPANASGVKLGAVEAFREEMTDLGFELPKRSVEAIDFELIDPTGTYHKLSAYRGNVVFLNFWATWCVPCRTEMPAMQALYDTLREGTAFRMIAINMQETPPAVSAFVDELALSFDILIDESGKTGATYGARTLPISYVIGKDGAIMARIIGVREWSDSVYVDLFQRLAAT